MWAFMGCIMVEWATRCGPGVLPTRSLNVARSCKESGAWTSLPYAVDPDAPVRSLESKER